MKKRFFIFLGTLMVGIGVYGLSVQAQTVITRPTSSSGVKLPKAITTTIADRVSQRETQYKADLAKYPAAKIKPKCQAAQAVLKAQNQAEKKTLLIRQNKYSKLANQLGDKVADLKALGIDTSHLTNAQQAMIDSINKFMSDAANYQSAVDDALAADCAADPTAFVSDLLEARTLRLQMAQDSVNIKSTTPDIKTALQTIKTRLSD
jgi:hypothetical protein